VDKETIIGIIASILTGIALLPQLIRLIKEKQPENISQVMLAILLLGVGFWVYYGFLKNDWIIIVSNGFSFVVNVITIILIIKYKNSSFQRI
jgi:MtN3 and saliva related transmembrane protein